ncbi:unnamed protein product [Closterium sp. NIES-65]|nr:unnamed protein product [Closterium sp. NIES-65]
MAACGPTKSLRFIFVLALAFVCLSSLHAAAASGRPGDPKIDTNAALQPPRRLAERYDMATAANSVNLDKARGLEEEEELPSHLGEGADVSAKSANPDKARGGAAEEEEGSHWAIGATTKDRAVVTPRVTVRLIAWLNPWLAQSQEEDISAAGRRDSIAHETITTNSHEALLNAGAGFAVGGVAGALVAGGGTYAHGAHAAAMRKMGKIGSGVAVVPHLPVLEHPQP